MGLFDIFFKKTSDKGQPEKQVVEVPKTIHTEIQVDEPIDNNLYLQTELGKRLIMLDHKVERHPQYLALIVNSELEIAFAIINDPTYHPSILHLTVLTIHPKYFPDSIEENIVGVGASFPDKVNSVLDNYINTTFLPIIDSFTDSHNPKLDFSTMVGKKEIIWHPKLGDLTIQGQWKENPENEHFFDLLSEKIKGKLTTNKINWLKVYISKRGDGTIIGECLFNNEPWEEGLEIISQYARTWKMTSDFQGLKQFIMFRRCDACDQ
jgi:Family of unknown function (DUF6348)